MFCHTCGIKAHAADKYCRACGTLLAADIEASGSGRRDSGPLACPDEDRNPLSAVILRWGIRGICIVVFMVLMIVGRELTLKMHLSPAQGGVFTFLWASVLFGVLTWVVRATKPRAVGHGSDEKSVTTAARRVSLEVLRPRFSLDPRFARPRSIVAAARDAALGLIGGMILVPAVLFYYGTRENAIPISAAALGAAPWIGALVGMIVYPFVRFRD